MRDERAAQIAEAAVRADDDDFIRTRREGRCLIVEAEASTVRGLLRALDDALAASSVSEDLLRAPPFDTDSA